MRSLSPFQNILFRLGGILMLLALVLPLFSETLNAYAAIAFSIGALLFASMQMLMRYEGREITLRQLRRQQIAGAIFLIITALLLLGHTFRIGPLRADEWKLTLAIAAIFQVYTAFRIPYALKNAREKLNKE